MTFWVANRSASREDSYELSVREPACLGGGRNQSMMGGVGMGAAIAALEEWSGKPLLWSTTQFITRAALADDLTLQLQRIGGGRNVIQCEAKLIRQGQILQQTLAALGSRDNQPDAQFVLMPEVPAPEDCPVSRRSEHWRAENLMDQFEFRKAVHNAKAGIDYVWIRPVFSAEWSSGLLALMSDFFLGGHPRTRSGTSLDNTFRPCTLRSTDWVLAVIRFASFQHGVAHGTQYQYTRDGHLLSVSSQTGLMSKR